MKYNDYDELINKVGKEYPIEYDSNLTRIY